MTNLELMICEAENAGEIDLDTRDTMLGILCENGVSTNNREKIREITSNIRKLRADIKKYEEEGNPEMAKKASSEIKKLSAKRRLLTMGRNSVSNEEAKNIMNANGDILKRINNCKNTTSIDKFEDEVKEESSFDTIFDKITEIGTLNESTAQARQSTELRKRISQLYAQIEKLENQQWKYEWKNDKEMADKLEREISRLEKEADRLSEKAAKIDRYGNADSSYYYGRKKNIDKGRAAASENPYRSTGKCTKESVLEEIYEAELCGDITPEERMTLIDYMDM